MTAGISGDIAEPQGMVDLTCATEIVPAVTSNALLESTPPAWPQADVRE